MEKQVFTMSISKYEIEEEKQTQGLESYFSSGKVTLPRTGDDTNTHYQKMGGDVTSWYSNTYFT